MTGVQTCALPISKNQRELKRDEQHGEEGQVGANPLLLGLGHRSQKSWKKGKEEQGRDREGDSKPKEANKGA